MSKLSSQVSGVSYTINIRDKQFKSTVISKISDLLYISKTPTTPYHPQLDWLVEQFNHILVNAGHFNTHSTGKITYPKCAWLTILVSNNLQDILLFFGVQL